MHEPPLPDDKSIFFITINILERKVKFSKYPMSNEVVMATCKVDCCKVSEKLLCKEMSLKYYKTKMWYRTTSQLFRNL